MGVKGRRQIVTGTGYTQSIQTLLLEVVWYNTLCNNMTVTKVYGIVLATLLSIVLFGGYIMGLQQKMVLGAAPPGVPATLATTSNPALVSQSAQVLFATSSCMARVITTSAQPIMLTFSDYLAQSPTGSFGHLQAASTTVVYDGSVYGCGLVKAFSQAAQVVSVTETR